MPKAERGTPKDIANRIKAKGLQKLKYYCQMCQKQCRDANGFKCHLTSENHLRQMKIFSDNAGGILDTYSKNFERAYVSTLRMRHGTKPVNANVVYQEVIQDKQHIHMNATHWTTLTEFVQYLGKTGKCTVQETERGWFVTYIERDVGVLARKEALAKREQAERAAETAQAERMELQRIEAAKALDRVGGSIRTVASNLQRTENDQPIKVNLSSSLSIGKNNASSSMLLSKKRGTVTSSSSAVFGDDDDDDDDDDSENDDDEEQQMMRRNKIPPPPIMDLPPVLWTTSRDKNSKNNNNDDSEKNINNKKRKNHQTDELQQRQSTTAAAAAAHDDRNNHQVKRAKKKYHNDDDDYNDKNNNDKNTSNQKKEDYWLYRDIIVRVISKKLAGGKYFKRKAIVDKVIDKYAAEVELLNESKSSNSTSKYDSENDNDNDDNNDVIILRLDQDDLETVIPKQIGTKVRILVGTYRGEKATVLELDKRKCRATLQILSSKRSNERRKKKRNDIENDDDDENGIILKKVPYEDFSLLATS